MLTELMETSSESDKGLGSEEGSERVSGVREGGSAGRPGRQLGGSGRLALDVISAFTVWIICKGDGFTFG